MEVCVEYLESAINAEKGGGIRLELCSALSEGGLTPSAGLLRLVKQKVKIPVYVMIRPRTGNDFIYTEDELCIMEEDIEILDQNGADGFVFGVLNNKGGVDKEACKRLLKRTKGKPVTFHRAFDMTQNPFESLDDIISLRFSCILTSGQKSSAEKGVKLIKELINKSSGKIAIMPGCGINSDNLLTILSSANAKDFHATGRSPVSKPLPNSSVKLGHVDDESMIYVTDENKIKNMVEIFNNFKNSK